MSKAGLYWEEYKHGSFPAASHNVTDKINEYFSNKSPQHSSAHARFPKQMAVHKVIDWKSRTLSPWWRFFPML